MPEKILVVDDNVVNRKLLTAILKGEGYEFSEAEDGVEAIEIASREIPDLILLDIEMPKKDGYETCIGLKTNSRTTSIPVIFLSAKTRTEDKIKGLDLGGADYVTKPFDRGEILARVRAQLKIARLTKEVVEANKELREKQERLDEDLKAAAGIQRSLLPQRLPEDEVMEVAWQFMPCEKIGGDIFNVIRLDEVSWGIYVLDVSGHGVPSALVAVSASQIMHSQQNMLLKRETNLPPFYEIVSPGTVLNMLDKEYPLERFNKFFTISYIVLNTKESSLIYSNAAHPSPVLLKRDGSIERLDKGGTVIGMGGLIPFEEGKNPVQAGDKLIVFTDGLLEYQDRDGTLYGEKRFLETLLRLKENPISLIINGIIDSVMNFGDHNDPQDDITLLGIELKGDRGTQ